MTNTDVITTIAHANGWDITIDFPYGEGVIEVKRNATTVTLAPATLTDADVTHWVQFLSRDAA